MRKPRIRIAASILGALAILFGVYVFFLRPWHLHWGTTQAELTRSYAGDELLPGVTGHVTHAITIRATPEQIWPWLMQLGQDRAGFYSYHRLENLFGCEMPEVEQLRPEWPARVQGEKVWFATPKHYGGKAYMTVAVIQPQRALVLSAGNDLAAKQEATWGFFLEPAGANATRLIVRVRSGSAPGKMSTLLGYTFWEPAHFIMEHRMMTKIRTLAERTPS